MGPIEEAGGLFGKAIAVEISGLRKELRETRDELRGEMHGMRDELRGEMHGMRDELRGEMHGMRDELRGEMHGMRDELRGEMHEIRDDLKGDIAQIRAEMATKTEMATKSELAEVRSDIARLERLTLALVDAVNENTVLLREELNSQFQQAGLAIRLKTSPRQKKA